MAEQDNTPALSPETQALAELGRTGGAPPVDPLRPVVADPSASTATKADRPEYIPEKFWDAEAGTPRLEDLAKSYAELERQRSQPKVEEPKVETPKAEEPKVEDEKVAEAAAKLPTATFEAASAEFAEKGELTPETRKAILDVGVPEEFLDTYLQGVQAIARTVAAEVYDLAGGEDVYSAAIEFARENWTQDQVDAFDQALANPNLRGTAVKGLIADFRSTAGGEGVLTTGGSGSDAGNVYHDKQDFLNDLADAEKDRTPKGEQARRAAIAKLQRSKKAGTLKEVTPRTGLSAFGR